MNTKYFTIIDGPNKDLLFDAVKYAYSQQVRVNTNFTISIDPKLANVCFIKKMRRIVGVEHEDGSGDSFNIHGYVLVCLFGKDVEARFRAYYNTRTRKGTFSVVLP